MKTTPTKLFIPLFAFTALFLLFGCTDQDTFIVKKTINQVDVNNLIDGNIAGAVGEIPFINSDGNKLTTNQYFKWVEGTNYFETINVWAHGVEGAEECQGTPSSTDCSTNFLTQETCDAYNGHNNDCNWLVTGQSCTGSYCGGLPSYGCSVFIDEPTCSGNPTYCYWTGSTCEENACSSHAEPTECGTANCSWVDCTSYGTQEDCTTNSCNWGDLYGCSGTLDTCSGRIETDCDEITGCNYSPLYVNQKSYNEQTVIDANGKTPQGNVDLNVASGRSSFKDDYEGGTGASHKFVGYGGGGTYEKIIVGAYQLVGGVEKLACVFSADNASPYNGMLGCGSLGAVSNTARLFAFEALNFSLTGDIRVGGLYGDLWNNQQAITWYFLGRNGSGAFNYLFRMYGDKTTDFFGDVKILANNAKLKLGSSSQSALYYNGTDLYVNPKETGSGKVVVKGDVNSEGTIKAVLDLNALRNLDVDVNSFFGNRMIFTQEGCQVILYDNNAGVDLNRGNVVKSSLAKDYAVVIAEAGNEMPIGAIYEKCLAGKQCKVGISGLCPVQFDLNVVPTRGYVAFVDAGANGVADNSATIPALVQHNGELGHVMQNGTSGGIAYVNLHYN